jgi:hypothetical protein
MGSAVRPTFCAISRSTGQKNKGISGRTYGSACVLGSVDMPVSGTESNQNLNRCLCRFRSAEHTAGKANLLAQKSCKSYQ